MADRISKLPDEVLGRILSFLPTENAVATSVLSKRWKLLWHLVSTLDFDYNRYLKLKGQEWESEESATSFINFVSAAILSPGLHQPIKTFKLAYEPLEEFPYSDVEAWFKAAIQRQVQNLKIVFCISQIPCCILSCSTLVVLNLYGVMFHAFSSVHLPALKTLHLNEVVFSNIQFFVELLNGCPILDLVAAEIHFGDDSFEGKVKTLPKLVSAEVFSLDELFSIPMEAYSNVEFLRMNQCDVDIPMFPNLTYLELFVGGYDIKWSVALDMLNHCPKLQTVVFELTLGDEDDVWPDPGFVPECFSSHLRKCFLRRLSADECQMKFARYVMQNSTLLRTMTISSAYPPHHPKRLEMLTELRLYPRGSAVCELLIK